VAAVGGAAALEAEAKPGQQAKRQGKDKKGKAQAKDKHKGKAQGKHKGQAQDKKKNKGRVSRDVTAVTTTTACVTPETCTSSTQCCDPNIPQCGTFGDTAGECCRTTIGIYCDTVANGNNCCGPNYVCAPGTTFPVTDPTHFGCQCNTAGGFTQQDGGCHCLTGCIIGGVCADASHCATTTTARVCISDGNPGNVNHPDLCCSGCLCPDGNCCNALHCVTTTTAAVTTTTAAPCTSNADCPGKQICCGPNTDKPGRCVGHGKNEGNKACFTPPR